MTTSVRIGVLGLGRMGLTITRALVAGSDERDVATWSEIIVTVLPGSPELLSAMEGSGGAIDALPAGSC